MSRRHHGRPHHGRHRNDGPRPDAGASRPVAPAPQSAPVEASAAQAPEQRPLATPELPARPPVIVEPPPPSVNGAAGAATPPTTTPHVNGNGHAGNGHAQNGGNERPNGCTAPQLRRFIKSRPYVPMHELRRRFAIDGTDDDVTQVDLDGSRVYVGLPAREGSLLGELLRGGEIGYELSFDPLAPIVVGVYPMRPVPRS
jgi:hypothetical protein